MRCVVSAGGRVGRFAAGSPFAKKTVRISAMTGDLIVLENVVYRRGRKTIFNGISLSVQAGKTVGIMGPSGTGKTTLLRLIGGQVTPDSGAVYIRGKNVASMSRAALFEARKEMGMLFQSGALFTDLSVFENVAFPLRVHTDLAEAFIRDLVLMKLQSVGLRGAVTLFPAELSGGMQRRVALARALALDPSILMYDEPFAGLDPIAKGVIVELIAKVAAVYGTTSLLVSHDIEETASICDYLYLLADGQVIGEGNASQLRDNDSPRVRQFVSGLPDGPVPFHYPATDYAAELLEADRQAGWFNFD